MVQVSSEIEQLCSWGQKGISVRVMLNQVQGSVARSCGWLELCQQVQSLASG
jgi:hypothetical protein